MSSSTASRPGRAGLCPLLPLLLSLARAAAPPPPAPRQLIQQALQSVSPIRPLQTLQNAALNPPRPLQTLQSLSSLTPLRPLQTIQSLQPVRPLQNLQGVPILQNLETARPFQSLSSAGSAVVNAIPLPHREIEVETATERSERVRRSAFDQDEEIEDQDAEASSQLMDQIAEEAAEDVLVSKTEPEKPSSRQEKSLNYYDAGGYLAVAPSGADFALDYDEAGLTVAEDDGNELVSRAAPYRKQTNHQGNSPIYYIRLPPTPYVLVPGVGYVSPPSRRPLPPLAPLATAPPQHAPPSPFYNLPLAFVSNGKPSGVYQPSWGHQQRPRPPPPPPRPIRPPSSVFNLDKGPYVFNGRPTDLFILRDTYDTLYGDTLNNFYP